VIAWIQEQASGIVAGGSATLLVRELIGFAMRLRAARLLGDADPANDAEAEVLKDAADRVAPR
jgi:hypothetical protein